MIIRTTWNFSSPGKFGVIEKFQGLCCSLVGHSEKPETSILEVGPTYLNRKVCPTFPLADA